MYYTKKVSAYIYPLIVSIFTTFFIVLSNFFFEMDFSGKIISLSVCYTFMWFLLYRNSAKKQSEFCMNANPNLILLIGLIIAYFYCSSIWSTNSRTLNPVAKINNGTMHQDILFYTSIAESFRRGILPRLLINLEPLLYYHTLSSFLVNIIGTVLNIPNFFIDNYCFPILCLPLYIFSQLYAISMAKAYFSKNRTIETFDVFAILIFNVGLFHKFLLGAVGIWKTSFIASESFLIANILLLLFLGICFKGLSKHQKAGWAWWYIFIPIVIFLLSWGKISVGFLFILAISYYLLRTDFKAYWFRVLIYGCVFIICMVLFHGLFMGSTYKGAGSPFRLLAFKDYTHGIIGLCIHIGVISFMPAIFIWSGYIRNKYRLCDFLAKNTIWEEILLLVTMASFLPGLLLDIGGGSAAYFAYVNDVVALVLFCGRGITSLKNIGINLKNENKVLNLLAVYCIIIACFNCYETPISYGLRETAPLGSYYQSAMELRDVVKSNPSEYAFFLQDDAGILKAYEKNLNARSIAALYLYPALTGSSLINASYISDSGKAVGLGLDEKRTRGYGLEKTSNSKLNLEDAVEKALTMGKKKLVVLSENKYSILNLQ